MLSLMGPEKLASNNVVAGRCSSAIYNIITLSLQVSDSSFQNSQRSYFSSH